MPVVIISRTEGFRRAGRKHSRTSTTWPDDAFSAAQMEQLRADPMLTVEVVRPAAEGGKTVIFAKGGRAAGLDKSGRAAGPEGDAS